MDNSHQAASMEGGNKKGPFDELSKEELIIKCKGLLVIAQKAKQSKSELQNELESYKLQLDKSQQEKHGFQENLKTLQELVDSLTEQKLNYITVLDKSEGKVKSLSGKCEAYELELLKCKANITELSQKINEFDNENISLKRQNGRHLEENEQLINQLGELEAQIVEFNNIGLQQREQLQILESRIQTDNTYQVQVEELNKTISLLESKLEMALKDQNIEEKQIECEKQLKEMTELYENEKVKKDKANIKLKTYKEKILKCAACINQLKNSRFILSKTVKEYSENIPKWQNDILKASKVLDCKILELNEENSNLKEKIKKLEDKVHKSQTVAARDATDVNKLLLIIRSREIEIKNLRDQSILQPDMLELKAKYDAIINHELPDKISTIKIFEEKVEDLNTQLAEYNIKNKELQSLVEEMKLNYNSNVLDNLHLQIKALESEKAILVKEKLNARDLLSEFEDQNNSYKEQILRMKTEIKDLKCSVEKLSNDKLTLENNCKMEKASEINNLQCKVMSLQEQYDLLKKEYDNLQDLNGLLKEEVETLKLSLEQPNDNDNLSDLNVSFQADIVKLETKLAAYKQENASLLTEMKESRCKLKEFDKLASEYDDARTKLHGYKTENTELLNEMKEINQVLKERGEAISKLQKAIGEMERLIETLEQDRDSIKQENEKLEAKVGTLENDLKTVELETSNSSDNMQKVTNEKNNAIKELEEKEITINSLKEEIERLKQQQSSSSELPNEDMSTSTISKVEEHSRMKDLDETFEEKYTKLRIFALKLKKKLNETVSQLQNSENDKAKLEKIIQEHGSLDSKNNSTDETDGVKVEENVDKCENVVDLEERVKALSVSLEMSEVEIEKTKAELACKTQQLSTEIEAHKVTKNNLEKLQRGQKKKNVLSLEIEDYERSLKELTVKMEENKKKIVSMESTIDTQEGTITAMKTQIKLLEEQIKAEETQNRLIKEELQHSIDEGKEKDNVVQVKNSIISKLEQEIEDEKRKNEETDLEMTSLLSEKENIIISLGEDKAELINRVKRLEFKCAELNEQLRIVNIELADLKTEYTSYKVRAQAVLRQNQTVDHSQEEQLKEETAALRAQLETLTAKLDAAQEQCAEQSRSAESLRRGAGAAAGDAARAQARTQRLAADLQRLGATLDAERAQHATQITTLTQRYKTQVSELEAKLQKETEALRQQVASAQEPAKTSKSVDEVNNPYLLPVLGKDDSDGEMDINVSLIPREEGEGSESAPSPPLSKSFLGSGRSPVPLERLLEEGVPEDEALDMSSLALTTEQEVADLNRKLQAQQQRVKHVTLLLSESERECARMGQLAELLKSELRRVRGATNNAHNTEYMKNVTLKFLTLPPGDERGRLVPVLQKILTLTADETHKIQALAKGQDPNPGKGWGSYLPWPGGK